VDDVSGSEEGEGEGEGGPTDVDSETFMMWLACDVGSGVDDVSGSEEEEGEGPDEECSALDEYVVEGCVRIDEL
jgi:hypothetical protein